MDKPIEHASEDAQSENNNSIEKHPEYQGGTHQLKKDVCTNPVRRVHKVLKEIEKNRIYSTNYKITAIKNIGNNIILDGKNKGVMKPEHLYNVVELVKSNDPIQRFIAIDRYKEIHEIGEKTLTIREMPKETARNLKNLSNHYKNVEEIQVFEIIDSINPQKAFKQLEKSGIECKDLIDFWLTDGGIPKDPRLLNIMKSSVLPLKMEILSLDMVQRWNSHNFLNTNTGTGKTTTAKAAGFKIQSGGQLTEKFLFGGYEGRDYTEFRSGVLNGDGTVVFDEFNLSETPEVMRHTMDMLENGYTKRGVGGDIVCIGTVTVMINGNPRGDAVLTKKNLPLFCESFLKTTISGANPTAFGRRFGITLFADDVLTVKKIDMSKIFMGYAELIKSLIYTAIRRNYNKIIPIIRNQKNWIETEDKDYINQLSDLIDYVEFPTSKAFFTGQTYNSYKLKMTTIRKIILENLDAVVLNKNCFKKMKNILDEEKGETLKTFQQINIESVKNCSVDTKIDLGSAEHAEFLKEAYPNFGYKKIADMTGKSKSFVAKHLKKPTESDG